MVKKDRHYKRSYNITLEDYNKMFSEQKGYCLGCGKHQSEMKKTMAVDHCHETGKVRGLLCNNCNVALGLVFDNINILTNLIKYLKVNN